MSAEVLDGKIKRCSVISINERLVDEYGDQSEPYNLQVEYFNDRSPSTNKNVQTIEEIVDLPIFSSQEGRIQVRKGRYHTKKKSSMNGYQQQQENKFQMNQIDILKKQTAEMQLQDLRKQQKRERLIFDTVFENFCIKENGKIAQQQREQFSSAAANHQYADEVKLLQKQESRKSTLSLVTPKSSHSISHSQLDEQQLRSANQGEDMSPLEQIHSDKVEDIRDFKFESVSSYDVSPLYTKKKVLPPKSAYSQKQISNDGYHLRSGNNQGYQSHLNQVSHVYNIPINSVNAPMLAKNKKKNQLLIKMTPNETPSTRPQSGKTNMSMNVSDISYSNIPTLNNIPATNNKGQKSPINSSKQLEPLKIVRKIPTSSSSNSIPNQTKTNIIQNTFQKNSPYISSSHRLQNIKNTQQVKAITPPPSSLPSTTKSNGNKSASSLIKLLSQEKQNFISIESPKKSSNNILIKQQTKVKRISTPKEISNNQNRNDIFISPQNYVDADFSQIGIQKPHELNKYSSHQISKNIIFSTNTQEDNGSIRFNSKTNLEDDLIEEDISQIEVQEIHSTGSTSTFQLLANGNNNNSNNQANNSSAKKKEEDKSSVSKQQFQFYGTIREDENEDFDQTPMNGNNIFKRLDKKKREELDKQIEEEIFEESNNGYFDKESNSQDNSTTNNQINQTFNSNKNQVSVLIRPIKSRFQRKSPVTSPKRGKRGKSVNSDCYSNADQSFSAQNGVFEESMSMDSSMSSEFQFQGGMINCLQNHQNKEQNSQLSQNILDDLNLNDDIQKTETDEINRSTLTKDNLQKLVQQSKQLNKQAEGKNSNDQYEGDEPLKDYSKMNQNEKIDEINKIQKEKEEEKKRVEQERQKIFVQQMELERKGQMYKECNEKIQKETQNLINMKSENEKLKIQLSKGYHHHCKNKEEEEQYQQYFAYLRKKQVKFDEDIPIVQVELIKLEKQLMDIEESEKSILKEIQFLCNTLNYDISQLNLPIQERSNNNQSNNEFTQENVSPLPLSSVYKKNNSLIRVSDKKISSNHESNIFICKQAQPVSSIQNYSNSNQRCITSLQSIPRDANDVIKEGWLYKKSPSVFKGWKDIDGDRFSIDIEGYKRKFELKSNAKYTSQEWTNLINLVIEENNLIKKPIINTMKLNHYFKNDLMTEQDFLQFAESGDILLFETNNVAAKFQRKLTGSKYDHVAIIVKMKDEVRVFDSTSDEGVALSEWKEYIYVNDLYEKVAIRKLQNIERGEVEQALYTFVLENIGKLYSFNFKKLISYCPKSYKDDKGREKDPKEYFCSELIAKFFKNVDLLPQNKAASSYWPITFSQLKNLQLQNGASFGDEITIVLDRHRNLIKERKKEIRSLSSVGEHK